MTPAYIAFPLIAFAIVFPISNAWAQAIPTEKYCFQDIKMAIGWALCAEFVAQCESAAILLLKPLPNNWLWQFLAPGMFS